MDAEQARDSYDLIVIGGGPAGGAAAEAALALHAQVAVIERDRLGGTWLNYGWIPKQTLVRVTELWTLAQRLGEFGIETGELTLHWPAAVARAHRIVAGCADPKPEQLRAHGAHLLVGAARFADEHTIEVGSRRLRGEHILIATGAHSARPPIVGLEHTITHVEALELEEPPRSLAIIGGGIIGLEFAYLFARLGTRVVVLERLSQVLEGVDAEIRAAVVEHAGPLGITVHTGMRVEAIEPDGPGYRVSATHQAGETWTETFERVLLAAGMAPAVKGLGLEQVGVGVGRDGIHTDTALRTSVGHIWAAGDVRAGAPKLTQIASYEGRLAARNALSGQTEPVTERIVPYLIGLTPPAAAVGLTEEEAHVASYPVGVHRQAYREVCPAGNVVGEPDGQFKFVYDATSGVLLGAHAFGAGAPELVQQVAFALQGGLTLRQAGTALFTFPGLSEVVWYSLRPHPGDPA